MSPTPCSHPTLPGPEGLSETGTRGVGRRKSAGCRELLCKVVREAASHLGPGAEMTEMRSQVSSLGELSWSRNTRIGWAGSFRYCEG